MSEIGGPAETVTALLHRGLSEQMFPVSHLVSGVGHLTGQLLTLSLRESYPSEPRPRADAARLPRSPVLSLPV